MKPSPPSIFAMLLAAALAQGAAEASAELDPMAPLRAAIGDAACSRDDDCRTIAIGSKACGGPQAYLAWSLRSSDAKTLADAAEAYRRAQQQAAPPGGRISNCLFVADPGAACRPSAGGRSCQLLHGSSAPTR